MFPRPGLWVRKFLLLKVKAKKCIGQFNVQQRLILVAYPSHSLVDEDKPHLKLPQARPVQQSGGYIAMNIMMGLPHAQSGE